jgi:murein DD-endopeptidase MepM/ murein hydrolase activator NlpD
MGTEYANRVEAQKRLQALKELSEVQDERLNSLDAHRDELQEEINGYVASDDNVRMVHDMEALDAEVRKAGVGGPISSVGHLMKLGSDKKLEDLELALRQAELQKESFGEILDTVRREKHIASHTPSIAPCPGHNCSGFGWRRNPLFGGVQFHKGIDFANITGTPIYAPADGVVKFAGMRGGYGYTVFIDHGYGFETRYGHCSQVLVSDGQQVERHDLIAYVGATGWATGPHLHYEVLVNGIHVDPERYVLPDYLTE